MARKRGSLRLEFAGLAFRLEPAGFGDANNVGLVFETLFAAIVDGAFSRLPAPGNTNPLPDFAGSEVLGFASAADFTDASGFVVVLTDSPKTVVGVRLRFFRASAPGAYQDPMASKPRSAASIVPTRRKPGECARI